MRRMRISMHYANFSRQKRIGGKKDDISQSSAFQKIENYVLICRMVSFSIDESVTETKRLHNI